MNTFILVTALLGTPVLVAPTQGGWILRSSQLEVLDYSACSETMLIANGSVAALVDATGRVQRLLELGPGGQVLAGAVSADGQSGVLLIEEETQDADADADADAGAKARLVASQLGVGEVFTRRATLDQSLLGGSGWFGMQQADDGTQVFASDGTAWRKPISAHAAGSKLGLVSLASGRLSLHRNGSIVRSAQIDLNGTPFVSADGSLIVTADHAPGADASRLVFYDEKLRALGEVTLPGTLGLHVTAAPDGRGVVVAPAFGGDPDGPEQWFDERAPYLAAFDRTGKVRWRYVPAKAGADAFHSITVSNGARRVAALEQHEDGDRLLVFGEQGKVIYETNGEVDGVWINSSGESLYTLEGDVLSHLRIDRLRRGNALDALTAGP